MRALELKVPPVVALLVVGGLMWPVAKSLMPAPMAIEGMTLIAAIIGIAGIALGVSGVLVFRRLQTTVHPSAPDKASAVVDVGVYRFSRNPMYLGLALILTGWGVFLGDAANIVLIAVFIAYMTQFQIKPEERVLEAKFGAAYTDYKSSVRRWL